MAPASSLRFLPALSRSTLAEGVELALLPRPESSVTALTVLWPGGALTDGPGLGGTADLTAELLAKGTERDAAVAFAGRVEALGADLNTWAGREFMGLAVTGPGRIFRELWPLLGEMLDSPRFDRSEFQKTRGRGIDSIRSAKDGDPRSLLPFYAEGWIYGTTHPFGHPVMGDERSLGAIPPRLIRETWLRHRRGNHTLVSLAGDVDPREAETALAELFAVPSVAGREPRVLLHRAPSPPPVRGLLIDRPGASQGYFWVGGLGVDRNSADRVGLELVHAVLGGRFNSLLNRRLRVERGLTYGAHSGYTLPTYRGLSYLTSYSPTETTASAIEAALEVLDEVHERGFTASDLEAARRYLLGQEAFRYETSGQLSRRLATLLFYADDLEEWAHYPERLAAVTPERASAILNASFPRPRDCALVVMGDAERLLPRLAGLGAWIRHPIEAPGFGPPREEHP